MSSPTSAGAASSNCPFCKQKAHPCPLCAKAGLPILPLRYAVARADWDEAPKLSAPFGEGVKSVALPADSAHYTLRLLRPGFLYVFNESRNSWSAYVVTDESYLFKFEPGKIPPAVSGLPFACSNNKTDIFLARCVTVQDAHLAGKVWFGFSDVLWTKAVLKKHADESYRKAHMRSVDIKAWLGGAQNQPNAGPFAQLGQDVAEFASVKKAPSGFSLFSFSDLIGRSYSVSDQFTQALARVSSFDFSPHRFCDFSAQTQGLLTVAGQVCAQHPPMLLAVPDAAGLVMDLNALCQRRAQEWVEDPERKWKMATAGAISSIRAAVINGVVDEQSQKQKDSALVGATILNMLSPTYAHAVGMSPFQAPSMPGQPSHFDRVIDAAGEVSPQERENLAKKTWPKYQEIGRAHV